MSTPILSVITVGWNSKKWLPKLYKSLISQDFQNFEMIYVDNGSTDDSIDLIKREFPSVKIIENKENLGFSTANNIGAVASTSTYLLFLNPDCYLDLNTLKELSDFISTNKDAECSLMQLNIRGYNDENIFFGEGEDFKYMSIDHFGSPGPSKKMFYADGSAMVINRNLFLQLGGFDESYFMYSEDVDLSWRALVEGYSIIFIETAICFHFAGGMSSSTRKDKSLGYVIPVWRKYHTEKNIITNLIKNYSTINLLKTIPFVITISFVEGIFYLFTLNSSGTLAILKAYIYVLYNLSGIIAKRSNVQFKRKRDDFEIEKLMLKGSMKLQAFTRVGIPSFR